MGVITEKLQITDGFSSTFQSFNSLGDKAEKTLGGVSKQLTEYTGKQANATKATKEHGAEAKATTTSFEGLEKAAFRLGAALGTMLGVKKLIGLSDEMSRLTQKMNNFCDESMTASQIMDKIYTSAQKTGTKYQDMINYVSRIGDTAGDMFGNNGDAIVQFVENLNKSLRIAGASSQESAQTVDQMIRLMTTGQLKGGMLISMLANAPNIAHRLADNLGVSVTELTKMAQEEKLTAETLVNTMLGATDEINAEFESLPITFEMAVQKLKNSAVRAFQPIGQVIANAINSPEFETALRVIANGLYGAAQLAVKGFEMLGKAIGWVKDNLGTIAPILGVITAAIVAYNIAMGIAAAVSGIAAAAQAVHGAAAMFAAGATFAQTVAQYGLNAAIAACPVTWLVVAILAAVAAVVALIIHLHNMAQTGHTVFGDIAGVAVGAFTVIKNWAAIIANAFISAVEWLANAWNQGIYRVKLAIYNFVRNTADSLNGIIDAADAAATALANAFIAGANKAIGGINKLIDAINAIPGVDIGHVNELGGVESIISTRINPDAMVAPEAPGAVSLGRFSTTSTGEAWRTGFDKGAAAGDAASNKVTGAINSLKNMFSGVADGSFLDGNAPLNDLGDFAAQATGGNTDVGKVGSVKNVENVKLSDEDMKIYRDLAERRYLNQIELKTLAPNISVSIPESAAGTLSAEDVADRLKVMLIEQMAAGTAVAH